MEVHGTVYYETQRPPEVPAFVKNHGLLPQHELQQLLRKAKARDCKKVFITCTHSSSAAWLLSALWLTLPTASPIFFRNWSLFVILKITLPFFPCQLFIGFGFPYEGPAPLEAIANGCIFLQPKFYPPHSSLNHEFFRGKPTSREVSPLRYLLFTVSYRLEDFGLAEILVL